MVANHGHENYFFRWIVFSDFAPFLGDLGHSENLFEIIPPLSRNDSNINNDVVHLSLHYLVHTHLQSFCSFIPAERLESF